MSEGKAMAKRNLAMADITAIYEFHAKTAVEIINESEDELMPQLVAVHLGDEPGRIAGLLMMDPRLVIALQENERSKDLLMWTVKQLLQADDGSPDAVVHVSEGWTTPYSNNDGERPGGEQARDHPQRSEALVVNVHTRGRTYTGLCPIKTDAGQRRAVFEPLDPNDIGIGQLFIEREDLVKH